MSEGEHEEKEPVLKGLEDRAAEAERRLRTLEQGDLTCTTWFAQQRAVVNALPDVVSFNRASTA